jgi:hypothetical protein
LRVIAIIYDSFYAMILLLINFYRRDLPLIDGTII